MIFRSARTFFVFFAILPLFSVAAYSFELDGAWANNSSVCGKIFVKRNAKLIIAKDADRYGSGCIVDGNQVRGNIKSRKEEAGLVHLITSCSTDVALHASSRSMTTTG